MGKTEDTKGAQKPALAILISLSKGNHRSWKRRKKCEVFPPGRGDIIPFGEAARRDKGEDMVLVDVSSKHKKN